MTATTRITHAPRHTDHAPPVPRIRLQPTLSPRTLLDGGWWPQSTDPTAELPGLIRALDARCGPITHLILTSTGWDNQPHRLDVDDRRIRLGWFTSQPAALLTATYGRDKRVDLLVIPPHTAPGTAEAAMAKAADPANAVHAPRVLAVVTAQLQTNPLGMSESTWESEGGHLHKGADS